MALLQYPNTPCRYLNQSPAQILFARRLKDGVPCAPGALKMRPEWIQTAIAREKALSRKHVASSEVWSRGVREKEKLVPGDIVSVQQLVGKQKKYLVFEWHNCGK